MWERTGTLRRQTRMRLISLLPALALIDACNPQSGRGCSVNSGLYNIRAKMAYIDKLIEKKDYVIANDKLDEFFKFYNELMLIAKHDLPDDGINDDSGLKIAHAETELNNGNLKEAVLEKLSVAKGDTDYFTHICKDSDDER